MSMSAAKAINTIEHADKIGISEEAYIQAWQYLIDTGLAWSLQGWYGRTAKQLINDGICVEPITEKKFA